MLLRRINETYVSAHRAGRVRAGLPVPGGSAKKPFEGSDNVQLGEFRLAESGGGIQAALITQLRNSSRRLAIFEIDALWRCR